MACDWGCVRKIAALDSDADLAQRDDLFIHRCVSRLPDPPGGGDAHGRRGVILMSLYVKLNLENIQK